MKHDALVADDRPWVIATRVAVAIVAAITMVLVVTGIMLAVGYRPDTTKAFANVVGMPSHSHVRTVHGAAARLLIPAFGCLAIAAGGLALVRHRARRIVPVVVAGLGVLAASITGFLLPWDQLALRQVTVGTNIKGYGTILFGDSVRYVLVGNNEVGTGTIARWFWVHVVGTTLLLVVPVVVIALQTRLRNGKLDQGE
jgi:quinol-cytochrome oxidoreductase complex cytochrome b subunit